MTKEHDEAIEELLELDICERNKDGELKPTSDFLVWYYSYLIHEICECYSDRWLETDDDEIIIEEAEVTKRDVIENVIKNQIVGWTAQKMPDGHTYAELDVNEHTKIIYQLIEEIDERLMDSKGIK